MTQDDLECLEDGFDTHSLLTAVDAVDLVRHVLANDEDGGTPVLRTDLLRLHELAMGVVREVERNRVCSKQFFRLETAKISADN